MPPSPTAAQVLGRIEADAADVAQRAGAAALELGADRLSRVFDDRQSCAAAASRSMAVMSAHWPNR